MTKIFIAPPFDDRGQMIGLVNLYYGLSTGGNTIFTNKIPNNFFFSGFIFVDSIDESDYVLLPQAVRSFSGETKEYVNSQIDFAKKYGKQLIVFVGGDISHSVLIPGALVFKGSQYESLLQKNEFIVPPYVEDLGQEYGVILKHKTVKPRVGFCGWAGFQNPFQYIKYFLRNFFYDVLALTRVNPNAKIFKKGIYYRLQSIKAFLKSENIETSFIVRKTFSANSKTITIDPLVARKEYIDTMLACDFALAPKGDGNFSVRFFEALSLGRIPILIDTDCVLPLAEIINYDDFIIRVPYSKIDEIASIVLSTYNRWSDSDFVNKQKAARAAFETYLRHDKFFNFVFEHRLFDQGFLKGASSVLSDSQSDRLK